MLLHRLILRSFNHVRLRKYDSNAKCIITLNLDLRHNFNTSRERFYSQVTSKEEICNVGTIGHVDHGKTTLTAAITKYLSEKDKDCKYVSYDEIDKAPEEKKRGITINIAHIGYRTNKRRYAHTDCPGHLDFVKNMISGASQMDGAILIVAGTDGPMPQTMEHLLLAKQIGIKQMIVYINKADLADDEILELVEIEIRELLENYGFDSEKTPIIKGSALLALQGDTSKYGIPSLQALLDALDKHIIPPQRDYSSSFILPIDNIFSLPGRGTIVVGTVKRGIVRKGAEAEVIGFDQTIKTVVTSMEIFQKTVQEAPAGENVGALLRGVKLNDVRRGMWVVARNSHKLSNHYEAQIYLMHSSEGGRHKPLKQNGFCTMLYSSTWNIYTRFDLLLPKGTDILMPGEHAKTRLTFLDSMPLLVGQTFTIREQKYTVATGIITNVHEPIEVDKRKINLLEIPGVTSQTTN